MYNTGDVVLYGTQGVFEITDIVSREFENVTKKYYVLSSEFSNIKSSVFIPLDNSLLVSRMHPLISKSEALNIVDAIPDCSPSIAEGDGAVLEAMRRLLSTGDCLSAVEVAVYLFDLNIKKKLNGKKLSSAELKMLELSYKMVTEHLGYVLGKSAREMTAIINSQMKKRNP